MHWRCTVIVCKRIALVGFVNTTWQGSVSIQAFTLWSSCYSEGDFGAVCLGIIQSFWRWRQHVPPKRRYLLFTARHYKRETAMFTVNITCQNPSFNVGRVRKTYIDTVPNTYACLLVKNVPTYYGSTHGYCIHMIHDSVSELHDIMGNPLYHQNLGKATDASLTRTDSTQELSSPVFAINLGSRITTTWQLKQSIPAPWHTPTVHRKPPLPPPQDIRRFPALFHSSL